MAAVPLAGVVTVDDLPVFNVFPAVCVVLFAPFVVEEVCLEPAAIPGFGFKGLTVLVGPVVLRVVGPRVWGLVERGDWRVEEPDPAGDDVGVV